VESDATPRTLDSSVSSEFSPEVTQDEDHVVDENTKDVENQGSKMGQVQDSVAAGKTRRNSCKPAWLTSDKIVAYVLLVIEEYITSIYREAEIISESEMWKNAMLEEMKSFHKNDTWERSEVAQKEEGRWLQVNICKET